MKFFNIKMRNGETYFINETQRTAIKHSLLKGFKERPDIFELDKDTIVRLDQIVSITLDRD